MSCNNGAWEFNLDSTFTWGGMKAVFSHSNETSVQKFLDQLREYHLLRIILDLKLLPCSECCNLSFGWFPGVWILCANVSEHCVCSIFIGCVSRKNSTCLHHRMDSVWKHQYIKFRCQGITQKIEYST
jgi:hypothetical protein